MHRFNKLNFIFLAVALLIAPLALNAQKTSDKWSGVHVGVIGGTAAGNYNTHTTDGTDYADLNSSLAGGRVGVQGGVDFHVKGLVVGAVADWSWSNAKFKINESLSGSTFGELKSTVKQITTVRARVGKRYGHVLPYVHGGLLLADTELSGSALLGSGTIPAESHVHPGFVVGGGFEYYVARHYSLSTEYGYNHASGNTNNSSFGITGPGITTTENPHFSTLTVGANYRF
jgi:opacity protein-like surface antigen